MQSCECQVTGLCNAECGFDCFEIPEFPDQDDIRILSQSYAEGIRKAVGVWSDFTLVDAAFFVAVNKFDRVLNRKDVNGTLAVDFIEQ